MLVLLPVYFVGFCPSPFPGDWVWVVGGAKWYMSPRQGMRELIVPGLLLGVSALFFLLSVAGFFRWVGVYGLMRTGLYLETHTFSR